MQICEYRPIPWICIVFSVVFFPLSSLECASVCSTKLQFWYLSVNAHRPSGIFLILLMLLDQTVPRTCSKSWYLLKLMASEHKGGPLFSASVWLWKQCAKRYVIEMLLTDRHKAFLMQAISERGTTSVQHLPNYSFDCDYERLIELHWWF